LEAALSQRAADNQNQQIDINRQIAADAETGQHQFVADQQELNRQATTANVLANKSVNNDKYQEGIFNEAVAQAQFLPADPAALMRYYPMLSPDRISRLAVIAAGQQKAIVGQQSAADAPTVEAATRGADLARAGNLYNRLLADNNNAVPSATSNPTVPLHPWYNPLRYGRNLATWFGADLPTAPENIIQPSQHAIDRAALLQSTLAPQITPAAVAGKNSEVLIDGATGKLVPAFAMPASAVPQSTAAPVDVLRAQAVAAISAGKDPVMVRDRFKKLTGLDL
jgi:hypothetical protein